MRIITEKDVWPRSHYYWSLATAMTLLGRDTIVDAENVSHDWQQELIGVLQALQQPDGSWVNLRESDNPREALPAVTTSYALMTLTTVLSSSQK